MSANTNLHKAREAVVTNPTFSCHSSDTEVIERNHIMLVRHNEKIGWCGNCFREYVAVLMEHEKKFLIIGSKNAITYRDFFKYLRDDLIWIGCNNVQEFLQPDGTFKKFGNIGWYTNLDINKRHEKIILWKNYTPEEFPTYDNYNAINVDKVDQIPCDYYGIMGVPITFLDKYNPEQFELLGVTQRNDDPYKVKRYTTDEYANANDLNARATILVDGVPKSVYARILIRKKEGV